METAIKWIAGVLLVLWIVFGNPLESFAGIFWQESNAPWEKVDAYYYPDKNDLSKDVPQMNVGSVEACRTFVSITASSFGDPNIERGDYECGVGCKKKDGLNICRLTVE